jgi:hypothetical protein
MTPAGIADVGAKALSFRLKKSSHRSLIRLKRIYNFLCSMLVLTPFA